MPRWEWRATIGNEIRLWADKLSLSGHVALVCLSGTEMHVFQCLWLLLSGYSPPCWKVCWWITEFNPFYRLHTLLTLLLLITTSGQVPSVAFPTLFLQCNIDIFNIECLMCCEYKSSFFIIIHWILQRQVWSKTQSLYCCDTAQHRRSHYGLNLIHHSFVDLFLHSLHSPYASVWWRGKGQTMSKKQMDEGERRGSYLYCE